MSGGTQPSLRKYLGAIKDTTTVSLAKVNSDYKELDIAIVRATNHVERPSKEKHIRVIFSAISAARPRADVAYCIHALARRLTKTQNWAVALKTLLVIHRALREVDPTFREELINYGRSRNQMLNMSHFKDDSSAYAWDYSAWVRTYALYLEERLECFRILKYDVESDPPRTKDLGTAELLEQLPSLQQLLHRLLGCEPLGASRHNIIIHLALTMVASESIKIYVSISDGIINMVDKFFEMQRHDAVRALDIYRRAGQQGERLSEFYEVCKSMDVRRGEKFLKIEQPPASFLTTMEEYIRDAPRPSTVRKDQARDNGTTQVILAIEYKKDLEQEEAAPSPPPPPPPTEPVKIEVPAPEKPKETDLLGLRDPAPEAFDLDNKNAMALAIVPVVADNVSSSATTRGLNPDNGVTGWELALVTAPSSNETAVASSKLAGGLDKLILDSLYDDAERRASQNVSYNPWEMGPMMQQPVAHDPFYASNAIAAPHLVQMAAMAQQQQAFLVQQQQMMTMMMGGQQQQQLPLHPTINPFANPYGDVPSVPVHQPSRGYNGLI
ncbi:putative clathrin assembly protein At5g35200 [Zingiber officinale]|uniref:putative clathrin assembly protein At5g35200 n=1 Tax=Zingiber officinale TaxID=94328 RepID=UPI001C4B3EAA|nr:putative clathrin assembly protein At5g35200 [Zingiber officinale]XP_042448229.1 putative clathrin assembly protein At5g35200 [Zingiber officinale]